MTLVSVWCNRLSPSFSFRRLWRYSPSYFGPHKALIIFVIQLRKLELPFKNENKKSKFY